MYVLVNKLSPIIVERMAQSKGFIKRVALYYIRPRPVFPPSLPLLDNKKRKRGIIILVVKDFAVVLRQ